jgi:hypothetical protein
MVISAALWSSLPPPKRRPSPAEPPPPNGTACRRIEGLRGLLLRRILTDTAPPPAASDADLLSKVLLRGLLRERKQP